MAFERVTDSVEAIHLTDLRGLDPVTVYWQNISSGKGSVTILCYDMAWTAYFGAMSDRTIQQFFVDGDADYIVTKLVYAQFLKSTNAHKAYLGKIVRAIKEHLAGARNEH